MLVFILENEYSEAALQLRVYKRIYILKGMSRWFPVLKELRIISIIELFASQLF